MGVLQRRLDRHQPQELPADRDAVGATTTPGPTFPSGPRPASSTSGSAPSTGTRPSSSTRRLTSCRRCTSRTCTTSSRRTRSSSATPASGSSSSTRDGWRRSTTRGSSGWRESLGGTASPALRLDPGGSRHQLPRGLPPRLRPGPGRLDPARANGGVRPCLRSSLTPSARRRSTCRSAMRSRSSARPTQRRIPVLLKGPTGCGKTRFVEHMAWQLAREHGRDPRAALITVSCHDDLTAADLVGRYLLSPERHRPGSTAPSPRPSAPAPSATSTRSSRPARTPPSSCTPSPTTAAPLPLERLATTIPAHPDFLLVVSYNPGYQAAAKDLKPSTRQRFMAIEFTYPAPDLETRSSPTRRASTPPPARRSRSSEASCGSSTKPT